MRRDRLAVGCRLAQLEERRLAGQRARVGRAELERVAGGVDAHRVDELTTDELGSSHERLLADQEFLDQRDPVG